MTVIDRLFKPVQITSKAVTKNTPFVNSKNEIRGVYSIFLQQLYQKNQMNKIPYVYNCEFFKAKYFPPNHFISYGRKSKPAVVSTFFQGEEHNGVKQDPPTKPKRTKNPMNYAYWRHQITKRLYETIFNSFENFKLDGTFLVRSKKVAEIDELQPHIDKMMQQACKMNLKWVEPTSAACGHGFDYILKRNHLPPLKMELQQPRKTKTRQGHNT